MANKRWTIRPLRHGTMLPALAALAALSGCAGNGLAVATVASTNQEVTAGYHVAAGDKLHVIVFDEPTLTGDFEVGAEGDLTLPLIDKFNATGATPGAIAQTISDKLRKGGYVLAPRVSVEIISYRPFFVLGEVKTPGEYPYSGNMTLEQAVARAGGFTARADKRNIVLRRQDWQQAKRIRLDGHPLKIAPGDTITISESFF